MAYGLKIAQGAASTEIKRARRQGGGDPRARRTCSQRKPRELSGGQRQRVAMGRAIVRQPQVFLFDEPLSNLDAKLRAQTRLEIQKLHRELGITSLFVTHDQVEQDQPAPGDLLFGQEKAIHLCWVMHLVGDIHQPLHCVSLYCEQFPNGDHGGNDSLYRLGGKRIIKLHPFWDELLGKGVTLSSAQKSA